MGAHKNILVSKNFLEDLYYTQGLNQSETASKLNCDRSLVYYFLNKYGIKRKTQSECNIRYERKKFDGTLLEKAYMLGFRTGDLHIKYLHPSKTTIHVDMGCAINSSEIKIFNELFQKYGHISQCLDSGALKLWVSLDPSFSFLIRKIKSIPNWIYEDKNLFFAFFTGYFDAEGYIKLSKPPGMVIASKDYGVLRDAFNKLCEYGYHPLSSFYNRGKYEIKRLDIRRVNEIKKLSNELISFSLHDEKKRKMVEAQKLVNKKHEYNLLLQTKVKEVKKLVATQTSITKACKAVGIPQRTYYKLRTKIHPE